MSSFQPEFAPIQPAVRVRFGPGTRRDTGFEIKKLGCARAAVLSMLGKTGMAEALANDIGPLAAGVVPLARMHTPVAVSEQALRAVEGMGPTASWVIGGGSTIGLGKAPRATQRPFAGGAADHLCQQRGDAGARPDRQSGPDETCR